MTQLTVATFQEISEDQTKTSQSLVTSIHICNYNHLEQLITLNTKIDITGMTESSS